VLKVEVTYHDCWIYIALGIKESFNGLNYSVAKNT